MTQASRPDPWRRLCTSAIAGLTLAVFALCLQGCSDAPPLQPWHTEALNGEFTAAMAGREVRTLQDLSLIPI